jgi:hypothetical protein
LTRQVFNVACAADKHDRHSITLSTQLLSDFHAGKTGHALVEHDQAGILPFDEFEALDTVLCYQRREPETLKRSRHDVAKSGLVIHDENANDARVHQ